MKCLILASVLLVLTLSTFAEEQGVAARATAAPIVFLAPLGGENYFVGQSQIVLLDARTRAKSVTLEISRDGGTTFTALGTIDNTTADKTLHNRLAFTVSGSGSIHCKLRATASASVGLTSEFTISTSVSGAPGAVTATELADGSVTNPKLAALAVTRDKVSSGAASPNMVLTADGVGNADWSPVPVATLANGSVTNAKLANSSLTVTAGTGLSGGGVVSLGGTTTLSLGSNLTLGGTTTGTFSGDGSALTNLPAGTIANGSVTNVKLANSSLTVTAGTGLSGGGVVALGGTTTLSLGSNLTLGGTTTGTFSGDGSALTNLPAGTIANGSVTNVKLANSSLTVTAGTGLSGGGVVSLGGTTTLSLGSNLTLGGTTTGTFSGDGSGLSGLNSASLTGSALPQNTIIQLSQEGNVLESLMGRSVNNGVAVSGNYAYLANNNDGLRIIDITDPQNPVLKGNVPESMLGNSQAYGVTISGNYAYLANGNAGLRIIDITDPQNPVLKGNVLESLMGSGNAVGVAVSGNYAYLANNTDGLRIIDITDPQNPVLKGNVLESLMGSGYANGVAVSGNYAYLANSSDGFRLIDITNPQSPVLKGNVPESMLGNGQAYGVMVSGNYAYIANISDGFRILNVSITTATATSFTLGSAQIVTSGGLVGIGRTPRSNKLEVEGEASKIIASAWAANSDRRIKQDIQTVGHALETLDKVRLVDFRYTDAYRAAHPVIADKRYLNVIAQEFAEVFPDHVKGSGEKLPGGGSEILQVDTYPLTIYSAAAVQELHKLLKAKDAEIAAMQKRLARLEKLLDDGPARAVQTSSEQK